MKLKTFVRIHTRIHSGDMYPTGSLPYRDTTVLSKTGDDEINKFLEENPRHVLDIQTIYDSTHGVLMDVIHIQVLEDGDFDDDDDRDDDPEPNPDDGPDAVSGTYLFSNMKVAIGRDTDYD